MIKNTIYWKDRALNQEYDFAVVGSGIVGLCSAIQLKLKSPAKSVILFERSADCGGASIRNAGFVCYGSPTELLDDLDGSDEDMVIATIRDRYLGIKKLSLLVDFNQVDFRECQGAELFFKKDHEKYEQVLDKLEYLNEIFAEATQRKNAFAIAREYKYLNHTNAVLLTQEGAIDPYQLHLQLLRKAQALGIIIKNNCQYSQDTKAHLPQAKKYLICTNAYTPKLIPELDLRPVRNQVFMTQEIDLELPQVYHYDQGYIYFRKIDNRLLIGGARNQLGSGEEVDTFDNTQAARDTLLSFLREHISREIDWQFEYQWSGILGVGSQKQAIVTQTSEDTYLGVRLGGMGVAIGANVADRLTDLALSSDVLINS